MEPRKAGDFCCDLGKHGIVFGKHVKWSKLVVLFDTGLQLASSTCASDSIIFDTLLWKWSYEILRYVQVESWQTGCCCGDCWKHWIVFGEHGEWRDLYVVLLGTDLQLST